MTRTVRCETSSAILSFLQKQEADIKDKLSDPDVYEDESQSEPTWLDEEDMLAEYESSQAERANEMNMKAIQKRRAANVLSSYSEGIKREMEYMKKQPGDHTEQEVRLTTQLEANLARVAMLRKQADLLRERAAETRESLSNFSLAENKGDMLIRDCNILKIGPLFYSARSDDIDHKDKVPLMAKLTGNSLVLYHEKIPQITFYLVDVELPARPIENAPSCFAFAYRGAEQALCAGTEISCHTWMNALSEAWFCKNQGIKGTLVNMHGDNNDDNDDEKGKKEEVKGIMKHAVKENPDKGLVNMEVFVDDKNKVHMLVNGKEKPVTGASSIVDIKEIMKNAASKTK